MLALPPLKILLAPDEAVDLALNHVLHGVAEPPAGQGGHADRCAGAAGHGLYDAFPHLLGGGRARRAATASLAAGLHAVQQGAQGAQQARYAYD